MKLTIPISTPRGPGQRLAAGRRVAAFTMLELALCLGIIGVALVAIIGVLPTGMQVQRDNREDTIIYQDGGFFMEAIRSGYNTNMDVLANNLDWIEVYNPDGSLYNRWPNTNGTLNGTQIVGVLSLPSSLYSVRAKFWAGTGPVVGSGGTNRDLSFSYLLTPEVVPYAVPLSVDPAYADKLTNNLYEVRLNLRWPVLANGKPGSGRRTFRTMIGGVLESNAAAQYYFQPYTYAP